jgi:hypothetical protein
MNKGKPKKPRLAALISLLDDPDPEIFAAVGRELLKENSSIIPNLEYVWETSIHDECQQRIEDLIQKIRFKENYRKLRIWSNKPYPDLIEGFIIVSQSRFADINVDRIYRRIEEIRKRVWIELNNSLTSLEKITVLNHVLFNEYNFKIVPDGKESLQNHSIAHILESRSGSAIAFSILYNIIAEKLDLPVRYVDFPKSPILAYVDRRIAAKVHPPDVETDIIFYINPAGSGSISGRRELEFILKKMNQGGSAVHLQASSPQFFLVRLLESVEKTMEKSGLAQKSPDILQMISVLNKKNRSHSTS